MESGITQRASELLHHIGRRPDLASPRVLYYTAKSPVQQTTAQDSRDGQFGCRAANKTGQMVLAKVPFDFRCVIEGQLRLRSDSCIGRNVSSLFFPLLDRDRVVDDFDLPLIVSEAHSPAVALLI